jgi:hypothetical protein
MLVTAEDSGLEKKLRKRGIGRQRAHDSSVNEVYDRVGKARQFKIKYHTDRTLTCFTGSNFSGLFGENVTGNLVDQRQSGNEFNQSKVSVDNISYLDR